MCVSFKRLRMWGADRAESCGYCLCTPRGAVKSTGLSDDTVHVHTIQITVARSHFWGVVFLSLHAALELTRNAALCDFLDRVSFQRRGVSASLRVNVAAWSLSAMNSLVLEPLEHRAVNFLRKWQHHSLGSNLTCEGSKIAAYSEDDCGRTM